MKRSLNWLPFLAAGILLLVWGAGTPPGIFGKADAVGYAVCHQIEARSFHFGERRFPLCARCTGMYLGAVVGIAYQTAVGSRRSGMPRRAMLAVLGALAAAWAVDGGNSYLHLFPIAQGLYEPQNWLRLLTGTGMGLSMAAVLFPAFNQTIWAREEPGPALAGWGNLAALLGLGAGAAGLVLFSFTQGIQWLMIPLALLSAIGVLLLLTTVYTMVWAMLVRKENAYASLRALGPLLAAGFASGLVQIALLDAIRFWMTGTWGGLVIG